MPKIIILEGPDGAGKTFLAKQLGTHGFEYRHEGVPDGDPFQGYVKRLLGFVRSKGPDVVLDRFHIGEYVYGPVKRDTNYMTRTGLRLFNRICRAYGILQVLCLPPYEECLRSFESGRPEYLKDRSEFKEVWHRYAGLTECSSLIHYDWTKENQAPYWKPHNLAEWPGFTAHHLPYGTIGHPAAQFLIVGEETNTTEDVPFMHLGNSSGYLNRALREAGFRESEIALTNALRRNYGGKKRNLSEVRKALPGLQCTIALGNIAKGAALQHELPNVHRVPHPSQHKRFKYKEYDHYVQCLKEIRASVQ